MRVPMTEYLEIDLDTERWQCRRCGQDLPQRRATTRPEPWSTIVTHGRSTDR